MDTRKDASVKQALKNLERGQSLILIAVMMLAMIAMLALVLDGGFAFFQRRNAQTAADAGALAGARELCIGNSATTAYNTAYDYACTRNGADDPPATSIIADATNEKVTVTSAITFPNFIAGIFGDADTTVRASAAAGCYSPCYANSVLPVVWSCRPPVDPDVTDSEDCEQQRITDQQLDTYSQENPLNFHGELYIVMDSLSYSDDIICLEDPDYDPLDTSVTAMSCDFDHDGEMDVISQSGRSWVDLDGAASQNPGYDCGGSGEGSNELAYWIDNGFPCTLTRNTWIPEGDGNQTNVYQAVWDMINERDEHIVLIPVFKGWCKPGWPQENCPAGSDVPLHTNEYVSGDVVRKGAQNSAHFRIVDFAAFYISCVRINNSDHCPGQARFEALNGPVGSGGTGAFNNGQLNSMNSIEGYFIQGMPDGVGGKCTGGVDTGVYTLYLDQ